jgi:NAD(P)-dependent dehydrogenase (short-subunit alcohol dehydrogenase family)
MSERPPQEQEPPGETAAMRPPPRDSMEDYRGSGLLRGCKALVTGGDSGIGRAVAAAFAKEGADIAFCYLSEHRDADHTVRLVEAAGRKCVAIPGDLADEAHCRAAVSLAVTDLRGIDILVNNIATQQPQKTFEDISTEQWLRTFDVNIHSYYYMTREALRHMDRGSCIINTASINGLRGNAHLIDYSATKGAILAFTYSLAQSLLDRDIRVNCVAPGPVWTPLIPSTFGADDVASFGEQAPMGRAAEPDDIAPSYVFLAANQLSNFYSGEVLAPVGGETMPG